MTGFKANLSNIIKKNNSLLCVGLDSGIERIPKHIHRREHPQSIFNKAIIDATGDLVCSYKLNPAFYEARGKEGIEALKMTCDYIKEKFPQVPVILDAKRGDIGNSNEGYVKFAYDYLGADSITLHPYLGKEALQPFFEIKDKMAFILCRTSNPGAGELQDLKVGDRPLYQVVAEHVLKEWNYNGNCGLIVGATYPSEIEIVRHIVGDGFPLLIPGIGSQGGDLEKTIKAGIDANGLNAIINSSRGIIFAGSGVDFAEKARFEAEKLKNEINKYRKYPEV